MTEQIRQCWAYNVAGNRCDHPAGHVGKHMIATEWDDSECYAPSGFQTPTAVQPPQTQPAPIEVAPVVVTKCIACSHAHKSGVCKCGCHEFIG